MKYVERAISLEPASKDAWDGPGYEYTRAKIAARFGQKEPRDLHFSASVDDPIRRPNYARLVAARSGFRSTARRSAVPKTLRRKEAVKRSWEIIADKLSKAGWSWGWVSALSAFLELERITHELALSALLGDDTP